MDDFFRHRFAFMSSSAATKSADAKSRAADVRVSESRATELDYRPSYRAATIAAVLVFGLYLITLGPNTAMWDTSEYIAAAYILGIPHPPGNPFFVLLGRVFTLLPIAPSVAMRVNLLAAVCAAASAGMWFLITERVLVSWLAERWQRIVGGSLAALIGATAFTVWSQAVVNEKVYTVALVGVALIAWLTVRWCDDPDGPKSDRLLVLIAYVLGLGYANHMAGFLAAPAVGLAVLVRRPGILVRWRLLLACAGALLLGITPFATQPIRAAYFPAINEGEPTGCRTEIGVQCTLSKQTWEAFKYNFNREQYGKPAVTERQAPFSAQVGMWWLYFRWQWLRDAYLENQTLQAVLAALFLVLGLFGGWVHWRRDRQSFWFFGPLMFIMVFGLIFYLNFRYGYSQSPELGDSVEREVRDRDYFYLWSFSSWSVWAALGLVFVWESLAALIGSETVRHGKAIFELPQRRSWLMASPILLLACIPLVGNWGASTRKGDTTTRDFAHDLLNSVEPYGVLVTVGDNDTFPLWYAQEVEGIRQDVVIANTSLLNTDWYLRQVIRAPIRDFDPAKAPAIYRGQQWKKPTEPPLRMTLDEADAVPLYAEVPDTTVFTGPGNIVARITPRVLTKADIAVLRIIKDNTGRPVYFAKTSGRYGEELGLGPYLLTQGLTRKLLPDIPSQTADTVLVPGEGWLDLKRSTALWDSVFLFPASQIRKNTWVDKPSVGIPALYVTTGYTLWEVLRATGDTAKASSVLRRTEQVARAARIDEFFTFMDQNQPPPIGAEADTRIKLPVDAAPRDTGKKQ